MPLAPNGRRRMPVFHTTPLLIGMLAGVLTGLLAGISMVRRGHGIRPPVADGDYLFVVLLAIAGLAMGAFIAYAFL